MKTIALVLALFSCSPLTAQEKTKAAQLAQQQLDAYNKHDLEAFLAPYADTVSVYMYPNQLLYRGKETMRKQYEPMFKTAADLYCTLQNRIVMGNTVIDHELVIFDKNQPQVQAVAIYTIDKDKIVSVRFIMPE